MGVYWASGIYLSLGENGYLVHTSKMKHENVCTVELQLDNTVL